MKTSYENKGKPMTTEFSAVKSFNDIPGPQGHWLKGNVGQFPANAFHQFCFKSADTYGPISKIKIMTRPLVILSNPTTVQHLLKDRPHRIRRASSMERIFLGMGINGVFSAEGDSWKRQRHLMNHGFKPSKLKNFYPQIQNTTHRLCQVLKKHEHQSIDIQPLLMQYTVDITTQLAFGQDINTLENPELELQKQLNVIFPMISRRLRAPIPYWKFFKLEKDKQLDKALQFVKQQVAIFIQEARDTITERKKAERKTAAHKTEENQTSNHSTDAIEPQNLLEAMILAKDENGQTFSEDELFGNVITLLLAGEDTTANTIAWTINYLADHPQLQDEMYQEIQTHYPKSGTLSLNDLDHFPLTFGAAQEALRLKPVAPYLYLESYEDEVVEGYQIPKGTVMQGLLAHQGHSSDLFENADLFQPHRWLNLSDEQRKRYQQQLMPFGAGPRQCPGRQLAFIEMKIALIELLRQFQFLRKDGQAPAKETLAFTVIPTELNVNIIPRPVKTTQKCKQDLGAIHP